MPSTICSYQELNYTITIGDVNDSIIATFGPFFQIGQKMITQKITNGLKRNEVYLLWVMIATDNGSVNSSGLYLGI